MLLSCLVACVWGEKTYFAKKHIPYNVKRHKSERVKHKRSKAQHKTSCTHNISVLRTWIFENWMTTKAQQGHTQNFPKLWRYWAAEGHGGLKVSSWFCTVQIISSLRFNSMDMCGSILMYCLASMHVRSSIGVETIKGTLAQVIWLWILFRCLGRLCARASRQKRVSTTHAQ